jgi:hypothetical protein
MTPQELEVGGEETAAGRDKARRPHERDTTADLEAGRQITRPNRRAIPRAATNRCEQRKISDLGERTKPCLASR